MRFVALCSLVFALLFAGACSERRIVQDIYLKQNMTDAQLRHDLEEIRDTSGVVQVISELDSSGRALLKVQFKSKNPYPGQEKLEGLGYRRRPD